MTILHTLPIRSDALHRDDLFALGQEPCGRRQVGQEEGEHHAPRETNRPKDEKDVLPLREPGVDVADGVAQEAAKDAGDAVEGIVGYEAEGLLVLLVVHGLLSHQFCVLL